MASPLADLPKDIVVFVDASMTRATSPTKGVSFKEESFRDNERF